MGQKDAFGRDVGEDPLAAMGWDETGVAEGTTATVTAPEDAHERAVDVSPGAMPGAPRRPRVARALFITLLVFGALGALGAFGVPRLVDAIQEIGDDLEDQSFLPQSSGDEPDTPPPVGLQRESLVLRGNLVPALRRLQQRSGDGRVRFLRIAPDRIDVQVVTFEQRVRTLQHRYSGETQTLSDTSAAGAQSLPTFDWSQINPSAPRRIAQRAVRGKSSRELSYLVLVSSGAGVRWSAFLASGTGFTADADGRAIQRIGG